MDLHAGELGLGDQGLRHDKQLGEVGAPDVAVLPDGVEQLALIDEAHAHHPLAVRLFFENLLDVLAEVV